jgi:hypothetical protein
MRIGSEVWVRSYLRRCSAAGIPAAIVHHGDDRAGAIFLKINHLDGRAQLFVPAPAGLAEMEDDRRFVAHADGIASPETDIDAYLARQVDFDTDLWVIEIEDRQGRHLLDDEIVRPQARGST